MLRKKWLVVAGGMVATTAVWSWAATTYQIQTKLVTSGGNIQVRNNALQTTVGTVFNNFTTSADVPVTVKAVTGYSISSITKGGVVQTISDPTTFSTTFKKSAGTVQSLSANFAIQKNLVTSSVTTATGDSTGTVSPTTATVNYNGSVIMTATPSLANGYVASVTVDGTPVAGTPAVGAFPFTVSSVTSAKAVAVTFKTVTAKAGSNQVVKAGVAQKLFGAATGTTDVVWTAVDSTGAAVPASAFTTVYGAPYFTPPANGEYTLTINAKINGVVLAKDTTKITAVSDVAAWMNSTCNGCHNPDGGASPSEAFANWDKSSHKTTTHGPANCVTCHTDGAMPTAVNSDSTNTVVLDTCGKCHSGNYGITNVDGTFKAPHGGGIASTGVNTDGTQKTQLMHDNSLCKDCHGHDNTINAGYAEGGHGAVSDKGLNAFAHYDWSGRTNNGTRQAGNCDRCHTTSGFAKLLGDTATGTRLAPVAGDPSNPLACVACHTSVEGGLRTDAVVAGTKLSNGYFALFSSNVATLGAGNTKTEVAFPGYKNSSVCVPCHSGRTTDKYVRDNIGAIANYSTLQLANYQHAANMGQTFIGKGAWEFTAGKYANFAAPTAHASIGMDTNQGPCVGCHYSEEGKTHSLEVNFASATCTPCHGGNGPTLAKFEEFSSARFALDTLVRAKMDTVWASGSTDLNVERGGYYRYGRFGKAAGVAADRATAQNAYGAVYNWQLVKTWDRAAWAHNPSYARQIVADTLAYLQSNGTDVTGQKANVTAAIAAAKALNTNIDDSKAGTFVAPVPNNGTTANGLCISCHAVGQQQAGYVNDNSGVRAITGEFSKWSHHVTGATLQDAHCAACHLEGKAVNGKIVVDSTKHMADAVTHLRNADTDADMAWDPATPNHTTMDNFCLSCHDADGAKSAGSQAIQAVIVPVTGATASALNPFGDTISNQYDKMLRGRVVDADSQFNTANASHHAVKGKKYTGRVREGESRVIENVAAFTNNSSAALPGERETLYEAGRFVAAYKTLGNTGVDAELGDDSTLHCGDCHTVGQFKAGSAVNADGSATTAVIGAHGSENEYMLRNSIGTDALHRGANYDYYYGNRYFNGTAWVGKTFVGTKADGTVVAGDPAVPASEVPTQQPFLVCYNCHVYAEYGSVYFSNTASGGREGGHAEGDHDRGNYCNGPYNTSGSGRATTYTAVYGKQVTDMIGAAGTFQTVTNFNFGRLQPGTAANLLNGTTGAAPAATAGMNGSGAGGGNIFQIQCASCHNAGPDNGFGGIHGSAVDTYTDGNGNVQKPRRFLPGLGNVGFVPGDAAVAGEAKWEQEKGTAGPGCYTLSTATTSSAKNLANPKTPQAGGAGADGKAINNGSGQMFGTWGACTDHGSGAGTKAGVAGDAFDRTILRPVSY